MLLILLGGYFIFKSSDKASDISNQPEILMGIVVVTAIAALMTLLYILAAGFNFMGLTDSKQALGLPEGSIRAMIALILIMVFIIFGIYLFRSVGYGSSIVLEKEISADSLKNVNMAKYKDSITYIQATKTDTVTVYSIVSTNKTSDEGSRLAQQLLTTVGTLVVAISSFYFGSATVNSAISKDRATAPTITTETNAPPVKTTTTTAPTSEKERSDETVQKDKPEDAAIDMEDSTKTT